MFITFEGIDGCGKTTQLELLKKYLLQNEYNVVTTREPGGTKLSEQIRNILLNIDNVISPITELLLFESARSHLVSTVIKPALEQNNIVLSDRFCDSTTAYQGYGRNLDIKNIIYLNKLAAMDIKPDITFFLDVPFEVALERRSNTQADRMETIGSDFFQRVIDGFKKISIEEPERVVVIDALFDKENTFNQIISVINKKLACR